MRSAKPPDYLLTWILPGLVIAIFVILDLTNGNPATFFSTGAWGSLLYANSLDHLLHGNLWVDPQFAPGEYFLAGQHTVVYFGIMPIVLRAIVGLFFPDIYGYGLANLSMLVAVLLGLGSVWYTIRRIVHKRSMVVLGSCVVLAILFASPLSYLLVWAWTYHEIIIWGLTWALVFTSLYALWIFDRQQFRRWHSLLMGASVGMAMLSRPTMGLTLVLPYAFLVVRTFMAPRSTRDVRDIGLILPGVIACGVLAIAVLAVNTERWGSPFTFVRIGQNVQFVQLYPDRRAAIARAGEFNVDRLPTSLYYYLVPSADNLSRRFPFVTPDRELPFAAQAPQYDYIEGSRVPLPLSMTFLLLLAVMGAYNLRRFKRHERSYMWWFLGGAGLTATALLTVYAVALRYSAEFIPSVVFMALMYIIALDRRARPPPKRLWIILVITGCVSLYMTTVTAIAYKQFVWDVPPVNRAAAQHLLNYSPAPTETKHVINGQRYPVY